MLRNIILCVIVIIVLLIMVYKIKYKFWSRQPVFHYHNLWYWLFPPGIIQHSKPSKDKFYDRKLYFNDYFLHCIHVFYGKDILILFTLFLKRNIFDNWRNG